MALSLGKTCTKLSIVLCTNLPLWRQKYNAFTISESESMKISKRKLIIRNYFWFFFISLSYEWNKRTKMALFCSHDYQTIFKSIVLSVQEERFNTDFQDGGQLGFPIRMILASAMSSHKTLSPSGPMSYLHSMALRIWTSFWRREGSAGMDMWNTPMVQSRQPVTYRLMESVGLGGPRWHGSSWQRGNTESGSSRLSTLMIDTLGDLVWDL